MQGRIWEKRPKWLLVCGKTLLKQSFLLWLFIRSCYVSKCLLLLSIAELLCQWKDCYCLWEIKSPSPNEYLTHPCLLPSQSHSSLYPDLTPTLSYWYCNVLPIKNTEKVLFATMFWFWSLLCHTYIRTRELTWISSGNKSSQSIC